MNKTIFAGVEVSAKELLVTVRCEGRTSSPQSFSNDPVGHRAMVKMLAKPACTVRVCLESTGLYGFDAALALAKQPGIEVMVANPRAVHNFGAAMLQRSKTDPLDARLLAEFAERMPFHPWRPPNQAARDLCALARRLQQLSDLTITERNRLHAATITQTCPSGLAKELRRSIANAERSFDRVLDQAEAIVEADAALCQRYALLRAVKGLARRSAIQVLAELSLVSPDSNARQVTAFAGLDPREHQSGSSVHKKSRISKTGNRYLRRALFMPALVACRHQPNVRAFYQHLLAKGKPKRVALTAVMRKLLETLWAMLRSGTQFDGERFFKTAPASMEASHG